MLALRGCRVLDVDAGGFSDPTDVMVEDGVISDVGPTGQAADRLDLTGAYLLPGLIDCHVHVVAGTPNLSALRRRSASHVAVQAAARMRSSVLSGFTRLRDVGGADWGLAAAAREQVFPAPHLHYGGPALSQTGGHGDMREPGEPSHATAYPGISRVVDGADAVRRAAREELRLGASHIKMMLSGGVASPTDPLEAPQYSAEEISAAVAEAGALGRYVAGHCYTGPAVSRAVQLGIRSIEHGNFADDTSLKEILDAGAFLVPTLATYRYLAEEGEAHGLPPASQAKVGNLFDAGLDALDRAWRIGVPVAFGTDLLGPMHRHQAREFELRARVQPLADVIRSATTVAAQLLGIDDHVGLVRPGFAADLVAYDRDPLSTPAVLADPARHLRMVMVGGRILLGRDR